VLDDAFSMIVHMMSDLKQAGPYMHESKNCRPNCLYRAGLAIAMVNASFFNCEVYGLGLHTYQNCNRPYEDFYEL
jgi:hypothetical protein